MPGINLSVDIGGIVLKNPVMTASGTFGFGTEYAALIDLNCLGGIIVKGLSLQPAPGNPPPRIVETPCGMLNAIGLENVGVDAFINEKLPLLESVSTPQGDFKDCIHFIVYLNSTGDAGNKGFVWREQWLAGGLGVVKSIVYDYEGNLLSESVLKQ